MFFYYKKGLEAMCKMLGVIYTLFFNTPEKKGIKLLYWQNR